MGFLGFGNYEKAGPGVEKNAPEKHRFFVFFEIFFRKFWQLITLNLIYVLFCLPIVTIGPATAGLTYVLRNFSREEHAFLWMDFIDAFRKNWKQGLAVSIVDLLVIGATYLNFRFYWGAIALNQNKIMLYIGLALFAVFLLFYLFLRYYIYMVLVTIDLSIVNVFRNAFILGVMGFWRNLLLTVLIAATLLLFFFFPALGMALFPVLIPVTIGFMICFTIYPVFDKYLLQPSMRAEKGLEPFEEKEKVSLIENLYDENDNNDSIFEDDVNR